MIKAIETLYGGCRFRSRTEARWAVFFDAIGLEWEYEKEGFELPSGRYLPDFWFPKLKTWAEVKGGAFTDKERQKCLELVEATDCECIMLDGPPQGRTYWGYEPAWTAMDGERAETGPRFLDFDLCSYPQYDRFYVSAGPAYPDTQESHYALNQAAALNAASSARFEFGQTPKSIVRKNWKLIRSKKGSR